jgi:small-conductance mechanosensitive channel
VKTLYRVVFVVSLALVVAVTVGFIVNRYWFNASLERGQTVGAENQPGPVNEQPLLVAEQLAPLAVTREEQDFAQEALRLADHEVDLNFAFALSAVTLHPTPLSPAARKISARVEELQGQIQAQQADINRLKLTLAKAKENQKQPVEEDLQLQQALVEVAQEELDSTQQELIRAGGDRKSMIQRLQDQHEARHQNLNRIVGSAYQNLQQAPEASESRSVVTQVRAWLQLNAKAQQLARAREELKAQQADVARQRRDLETSTTGENSSPAGQRQGSSGTPQPGNAPTGGSSGPPTLFSTLKQVAEQQRDLANLDKRTQDFQSLDGAYGNWSALVKSRQRAFGMGLVEALAWIFGILMVVLLANPLLGFLFPRAGSESRRLRMLRVALRFALQMTGLALILVVIFGPPNQLATVLALAGAGLTVALKDFIVGFIGWFALMGPNGIRPGDWVEIDGIGGEVVEIGPLHTILLETGGWSDAARPTGRKVTFVNSFAIEGHYFNFSTSGQWLWDEIQVPIPAGADLQPILEAIQTIVTTATQANARLAEQEWHRAVLRTGSMPFSAAPSISVQPTGAGVTVMIRYITRAPEWRDVRSRLYGEIVQLLRKEKIPAIPPDTSAPKSLLAPVASR